MSGDITDGRMHHVVHHINLDTGEEELWVDGEKIPPALNAYRYDPGRSMKPGVWCVRHREGWCAVEGDFEPEEGSWTVPTVCGYGVTLPYGYAQLPTSDCPDCLVKVDPL